MKSVNKLDKQYIQSFSDHAISFEKLYNDWKDYKFDLVDEEITISIINRLRSYYLNGEKIKEVLDKNKLTPASDFFVEQVIFFIKIFLKEKLTVRSEKSIFVFENFKKKYKFPDISIWEGDILRAVIECKTQLGFDRKEWRNNFEERERVFKSQYKDVKCYFLVMTSDNWSSAWEKVEKIDRKGKYFCLTNLSTADVKNWPKSSYKKCIDIKFEKLLKELKKINVKEVDNRLKSIYKDYPKYIRSDKRIHLTYYACKDHHKVFLNEYGQLILEENGKVYRNPSDLYNNGIKSLIRYQKKGYSSTISGRYELKYFTIEKYRLAGKEIQLDDGKYPKK